MDYTRYFSRVSKNRKFSWLREYAKLLQDLPPGTVFLAGGVPNTTQFPFVEAKFTLRDGSTIAIDPKLMSQSLQYGATEGVPALRKKLEEMVSRYHGVNEERMEKSEVLVLPGSQFGLAMALEAMLNNGSYLIIEEHAYPGVLSAVNPYNPKYLPVKVDGDGMIPDSLREVLSPWKAEEIRDSDGLVPKVLYICPSGGNPTGSSLTEERKQEIYHIAQEYNLLIIEDDPYFFIQFRDILLLELLNKWGWEGFDEHVRQVRCFYQSQRDIMLAATQKHLSGLVEWYIPKGGMFLWMKVPQLKDTYEMIMERGLAHGIVLVPGRPFCPGGQNHPSQYLRASFSLATKDEMDQVCLCVLVTV
ncbi:unnamed protein product, partial [Darwinula stevensoni]